MIAIIVVKWTKMVYQSTFRPPWVSIFSVITADRLRTNWIQFPFAATWGPWLQSYAVRPFLYRFYPVIGLIRVQLTQIWLNWFAIDIQKTSWFWFWTKDWLTVWIKETSSGCQFCFFGSTSQMTQNSLALWILNIVELLDNSICLFPMVFRLVLTRDDRFWLKMTAIMNARWPHLEFRENLLLIFQV